jgi:hypothetical protein
VAQPEVVVVAAVVLATVTTPAVDTVAGVEDPNDADAVKIAPATPTPPAKVAQPEVVVVAAVVLEIASVVPEAAPRVSLEPSNVISASSTRMPAVPA